MALDTRKYADYSFIGSGFSNDDGALSGWMPEQTGPMAGASGNIGAPGYGGFISGEKWWQQNKNKLGEVLENFVDLNADTTASDLLPTIDPSLASVAANTGPFVTDPAIADVDDKETGVSSETAEQILAKYKDRAEPVTDMLGDYKQEDGSNFPVNVLLEIISDYAVNKDNKDAQVILGKWNDKVADTGSTPVGGTPQDQTGTPQGETNTPQGSKPTPQGGTPQGGTPTSDTPAVDSPIGTPTVSTGSVLDQTGTGDVKVDDQPAGLLNIPTSIPKQPEKKAGMIIEIAQSTPIVETVLDDYLYPPMLRELNNVKQSPFATALLFSNGLMGSFV